MKGVAISELKANLSRYLREVRRGGEVQILDRGVPVARLVGLPPSAGTSDDAAFRERLARAGIVRPGSGDASAVLASPPMVLAASLSEALDDERNDRR